MISYALLFQRNEFRSLTLVGIVHVCIYLCCCHIFMPKHLWNGIDAGTHTYFKGGKSATQAVEGDVLVYASCLYPFLQSIAYNTVAEFFEHRTRTAFTAKLIGFIANRKSFFGTSFLDAILDYITTIVTNTKIFPLQS